MHPRRPNRAMHSSTKAVHTEDKSQYDTQPIQQYAASPYGRCKLEGPWNTARLGIELYFCCTKCLPPKNRWTTLTPDQMPKKTATGAGMECVRANENALPARMMEARLRRFVGASILVSPVPRPPRAAAREKPAYSSWDNAPTPPRTRPHPRHALLGLRVLVHTASAVKGP